MSLMHFYFSEGQVGEIMDGSTDSTNRVCEHGFLLKVSYELPDLD